MYYFPGMQASFGPTAKARTHETETGPPCQRRVCFGRNSSPDVSARQGAGGAAKPKLGKQQPDPSSLGCTHGVHTAPQKIHMGRWTSSLWFSHALHPPIPLYQWQGRSRIDIGTVQKDPSPSPAPALLPPLPQPLLDPAIFRDPQSLVCV